GHEEEKHPEIHKKNRKAKEDFDKAYKKINDKLIYSQEHIFSQTKWDGEDMTDEEFEEKTGITPQELKKINVNHKQS
ncbi:hypothetical protein LCGC14_2371990, partial [marine sediment metagenome]